MTREGYEVLALVMRYVFVLLGAWIVVRAFLWLRRDHRALMREMKAHPNPGQIGELADVKTDKRWPVCQEGLIGSAGKCDICVKKQGLRRLHATYRYVPGKGVLVTPIRRAPLTVDEVRPGRSALALSGSVLRAGDAVLRFHLDPSTGVPERTEIIPPQEDSEESWMQLFEGGYDPDVNDPLAPMGPGGVPGFPENAPGAEAFLPDQADGRKE